MRWLILPYIESLAICMKLTKAQRVWLQRKRLLQCQMDVSIWGQSPSGCTSLPLCYCDGHHDQEQLKEKRVMLIFYSLKSTAKGRQGRKQEAGTEEGQVGLLFTGLLSMAGSVGFLV